MLTKKESIRENRTELQTQFSELTSDKEFVLKAIDIKGSCFEHVSNELKNDREVVFAAVKKWNIT